MIIFKFDEEMFDFDASTSTHAYSYKLTDHLQYFCVLFVFLEDWQFAWKEFN